MTDEVSAKDYTINVGPVNWSGFDRTNIESEIWNLYYVKRRGRNAYFFYCKTQEDANYLKLRFPEWIL